LGALVFENAGAARAFENRENPPGMAGRRRKLSNYGQSLIEKQKIKFYYGLREEQLRRYFSVVRAKKGNTGAELLILCERRFDNIVRRAGFTSTRPQARQGVVHGHFQINGRKVDRPSIFLNAGDVITVRNRPNLKKLYAALAESSNTPPCDWIDFDAKELRAVVKTLPTPQDVSLPVEVGRVVAFMSR
jgi:small subunit ribosomal protein S4